MRLTSFLLLATFSLAPPRHILGMGADAEEGCFIHDARETCTDVGETLQRINTYRQRHGAPSLCWSHELAASASEYARHLRCGLAHSDGALRGAYGENVIYIIQYPSPGADCAPSIHAWYNERNLYMFSARPFDDNKYTGVFHFTQLIWRGSKEVGCGAAVVSYGVQFGQDNSTRRGGCKNVVCRFVPTGNHAGNEAFRQNVLPIP